MFRGHMMTIEVNREELNQLIDKITSLKKEIQDYSQEQDK